MSRVLLVVLDGWGHSDFTDPPSPENAIELARVPRFRRIYDSCPRTRLACSGGDVGLPDGQMGNSEVGHLNLGAGRVVFQDIARIDGAIASGSFADALDVSGIVSDLRRSGGRLHLIGLVSDGGVHSHLRHFGALFDALPSDVDVHVHCLTDGRDTSPTAGRGFVAQIQKLCARSGRWRIASVGGRYFAMDRDRRWDRTERAYRLIAEGHADDWVDTVDFFERGYARDVTDEFVPPTGVRGAGEAGIGADDVVVLMNFRADRMRQLARALAGPAFDAFARTGPRPARVITLTEYEDDLPAEVAFPPVELRMCLSEHLSREGLGQLKVAETEKYAHVTYFFNGGEEEPYPGEVRSLVPSPKVATYDLQPEMSAEGVTRAVVEGIRSGAHHFILVNYANPDMVGHTGSIPAAVRAVETVDDCLGTLLDEVERSPGWVALVTADHGNAEKMLDENGDVHTAHTTEPVDFMVFDPAGPPAEVRGPGRLADVAPTVLFYLGLGKPEEMTGRCLVGAAAD